jgi:hypothetical protein
MSKEKSKGNKEVRKPKGAKPAKPSATSSSPKPAEAGKFSSKT